MDFSNSSIEFLYPLAGFSRNKGNGRKRKKFQVLADLPLVICCNTGSFLHSIPLIDGDDDGAAGLCGIASDVGIEGRDTLQSVHHENGHVALFQMAASHDDAEFLG